MAKQREPYIAVELEAIEQVPAVAALAGRSEDAVGWGLVKLWRHAWRLRVDTVESAVVEAFLPGCANALGVFGFIEPGDGSLVVLRGMRRYLRVKEAQARAARETNAKRTDSGTVSAPVSDLFDREKGRERADTATVSAPEERTANTEKRTARSSRSRREPSAWEVLFAKMQAARVERLAALGEPDAAQQSLSPSRLNQLLSGAARSMFGLLDDDEEAAPEERAADLFGLWQRYLWSSYWRGRTPPFPVEGFCARSTLEKCVALWGSDRDPLTTMEEWS